jgi:hypothetical protein
MKRSASEKSVFREINQAIILLTVFLFMVSWMLKTKPNNKPRRYFIIGYDVFGNESVIDGLKTEFKIHDVAWSFMKQYKRSYPLYNFALVLDLPNSEKMTIVKYI